MTFSEQLIFLIDEFAKRIGVAIDWTSANAMPYLQELSERYVAYELSLHGIGAGMALLGLVLGVWCFFKSLAMDCGDDIIFSTIALFAGILSIAGLIYMVPIILKLIFVPEFYIYERLMVMLK